MPDSTIQGLPDATALVGGEFLPVVQGGADRKATPNQILAYVQGNLSETIDDRVSALLVAGTNVALVYNDPANTITISSANTNLGSTPGASTVALASSTGTGATLAAATSSLAGVMTSADKTKLDGIAAGATVNSADAVLLSRPNHTGQQPASTISDFSEAVDDRVSALLVQGTNIVLTYDDVANTLTINATGTGSQAGIQFQDEGSNLSTSGTVDTINFVGAGVVASRVSNVVTVTIAGGGGGSGDFFFQSTAPGSPTVGARWVDSDTGVEYTFIDDGTSTQWVELGASLSAIGGILPIVNGGTSVDTLVDLGDLVFSALIGLPRTWTNPHTFTGIGTIDLEADNKELRIGLGHDLRIYHDGTNSNIENDTGDLILRAFTDIDLRELTTTTAAPAAGGAGALPATPLGYLNMKVDGVLRKFPYYA